MAFHSYTHLIQKLFNASWFGPPSRLTGTSTWTTVDHLVSRLPPPTIRTLHARFLCGSVPEGLNHAGDGNSQVHYAKGTPSHNNCAPTACRRLVSGSISLPSSGFFSPFPHGTRSLSVSQEYLALPDGPGRFAQDSPCPALLRIPLGRLSLRVRVCHPLRTNFPECSAHDQRATAWSYNPRYASPHTGFGLFPVRSPLLGESLLFSSPAGTKMFQFPAFASRPLPG